MNLKPYSQQEPPYLLALGVSIPHVFPLQEIGEYSQRGLLIFGWSDRARRQEYRRNIYLHLDRSSEEYYGTTTLRVRRQCGRYHIVKRASTRWNSWPLTWNLK